MKSRTLLNTLVMNNVKLLPLNPRPGLSRSHSFAKFKHRLYACASVHVYPNFISFYAQMGTNPTQCSAVCILGSLCTRAHTLMGLWWLTSLSDVNFSVYHKRNPRVFKQAHSWPTLHSTGRGGMGAPTNCLGTLLRISA